MTWQQWFLVAYYALNAVLTVAMVGRKREPMTPLAAAIALVLYGLLAWVVVSIGTGQ